MITIRTARSTTRSSALRALRARTRARAPVRGARAGDLHVRVHRQRRRLPDYRTIPLEGVAYEAQGLRAEPGGGLLGGQDGAGDEAVERGIARCARRESSRTGAGPLV